ncbi:unnamed protein product [Trichobilharzia regenti]|nr:unnamed protein product [Trichobilharzia regenti]
MLGHYGTQARPPRQVSDQHSAKKNDSTAKRKREQGNEAWRANKISLALRCYTESIFFADSCEEKALGYGNRSCVLSRIGVHEAVLQDIDLAIKVVGPLDDVHSCKIIVILLRGKVDDNLAIHSTFDDNPCENPSNRLLGGK